MPYHKDNDPLDKDIIQRYKEATICRDVRDVTEMPGWKNTIGPVIDRMIIDVLGGKIGDTWVTGKVDRARKDEKREFYIGYKQALIDLHSRVMFHITQLAQIEDQIKMLEAEKTPKYTTPMVDDTRYGNTERPGY